MIFPRKELEGVLLVDKPGDHTSHDVVARLRRKLNMKRIGHAGTLDPMATGLMILLIGKATKISQYLVSLDKAYEGTIELGKVTDTQDADGEVVRLGRLAPWHPSCASRRPTSHPRDRCRGMPQSAAGNEHGALSPPPSG